MPDCRKCGDHYTRGHYSRHMVLETHKATLPSAIPYQNKLLICNICRLLYSGGSYAEHRQDVDHRMSQKSQRRPCQMCGGAYLKGEYSGHRVTREHYEGWMQRQVDRLTLASGA